MAGKRVTQSDWDVVPQRKKKASSKAGWIVLGIAAAVLVGGAAGLGAYVNGYDRVFPGVTLGEESLAGLTREELESYLTSDELLSGQVSVTADGESLGQYTQRELGAYINSGKLAEAAWSVGREEGAWFRNVWTMLSGALGSRADTNIVIYYDNGTLQAAVEDMAAAFDREAVDGSYELTRDGVYATRPVDGRVLDQPSLLQSIVDLDGASGDITAAWESVPGKGVDWDVAALELNAEASEARYDIEQGKVVDGQVGVKLDPQAARFALDAAAPGETIQLPAEVVYPKMTTAELEAVLFRDELGSASTKISGTSARRKNVRLAGEAVDGLILNDGDVFDFNAAVGKRTVERGFGNAPAYINGETVESLGGGICQTSSTIYYAALLSNLEIVERYNHRYTVSYMPYGMDATVSWGGPEFRFKNDTGYPMRIDVICDNNEITVKMVGTKTDDTYVKMTYEVLSTTGYETEYVETDELDWGTQQVKQTPYTGRKVVSYRNVYSGDGTLISSSKEASSNYQSRNEIILVGTRGKPAAGGVTIPEFGGDTSGGSGGTGGEPSLPTEDTGGEPVLPDDGSPGLAIFG
ncbi:MAG: VanW family protein [Oscillospiraceae bacterium]|nr:VanW family protein [Oscillospiraceae bacterium]